MKNLSSLIVIFFVSLCFLGTSCSHFALQPNKPLEVSSISGTSGTATAAASTSSMTADQKPPVTVKKISPRAKLDTKKVFQKISFGSCAHQKYEQNLWTTIAKNKPDLHINLGDNVYASSPEDKPIKLAYEKQAQIKAFDKFQNKIPMVSTWDDHDYGLNDGGAGNPDLAEARSEFLKFYPIDAQKLKGQTEGIYHSFYLGKSSQVIQVILLDTRSFRSPLNKVLDTKTQKMINQPVTDKNATILGFDQWLWLEQELKRPAALRILVSSIQVLAEEHPFEKWANFPYERQKLLDLITRLKITNLVILSGDRHAGEISRLKVNDGLKLYDITASSINRKNSFADEANSLRIGPRSAEENFGLMKIDWKNRKASFSLVDSENKPYSETDFKF
jgi:alkaline phosphatase D